MAAPLTPIQAENHQEVLLILGASSAIGQEIIRRSASDNVLVLAHYHQSADNLAVLQKQHPELCMVPLQADLSQLKEVEKFVNVLRTGYPCPAKIVHLPSAKMEYIRFKDVSWDRCQQDLDLQVRSLFLVLKEFLPRMGQACRGKIVAVLSSTILNVPPIATVHYVAAKFALLGLLRALAAEYSGKRININTVSPSMVETPFLDKLPKRMVELTALQAPFQRNATPSDVAGAVRFLLSTEADYITGVNLPVSGGIAF